MYSLLSEIVESLIDPLRLALVLVGISLLLRWRKRLPRLRRVLLIGGIAQVWLLSTPLAAELLLRPLEGRYQRPARPPASPVAVIVLCGMTDDGPHGVDFSAASDRLIEGVALAHRFKSARLVFSGLFEAKLLKRAAIAMGIEARRIVAESESTNTRGNAFNTAAVLRGIEGPKLLVTSARHMPRARASFDKAGLAVIPWPVDHVAPGLSWRALIPGFEHLAHTHWALHEHLGLLAYKIAGFI